MADWYLDAESFQGKQRETLLELIAETHYSVMETLHQSLNHDVDEPHQDGCRHIMHMVIKEEDQYVWLPWVWTSTAGISIDVLDAQSIDSPMPDEIAEYIKEYNEED